MRRMKQHKQDDKNDTRRSFTNECAPHFLEVFLEPTGKLDL